MFRFVLAVTAAVIAVSAQAAADWELASTASNGMRTYIDISTITAEDDSRNTWEKQTYVKPERDGTSYTVNHVRYDCSNRTYTILSYIKYRATGEIVDSYQIPSYRLESNDIAPDTVAEKLLTTVCN